MSLGYVNKTYVAFARIIISTSMRLTSIYIYFSGNPSHGDRGEVVSSFDDEYYPCFILLLSYFDFVAEFFAKFENNFGLNVELYEYEKLLIPPGLFSNYRRNDHVIFYSGNFKFHASVVEFRTRRNLLIMILWI